MTVNKYDSSGLTIKSLFRHTNCDVKIFLSETFGIENSIKFHFSWNWKLDFGRDCSAVFTTIPANTNWPTAPLKKSQTEIDINSQILL